MKDLDYQYTDSFIQDSITQEYTQGGLIIESRSRLYFISKEFIEFAYRVIHEREDKDKT